jgi:hypothetical protein
MTPFRWTQVAAIGIGLVPLAAVAWATLRGRKPSPQVVLLACAFALSFADGLLAWKLRANGHETLWLTFVVIPVQYAVLMAVVQPREHQRIVWLFYALIVAASWAGGDRAGIEMFVHAVAGAWIALVAYRQPDVARYRTALLLYCGATIPFLLAMGFLPPSMAMPWVGAWTSYQLTRLSALSVMAWAVLAQPRMRLEVVTHEPRDHRTAGRVWSARSGPGHARHRDSVAAAR